jgi:hypothetical protein
MYEIIVLVRGIKPQLPKDNRKKRISIISGTNQKKIIGIPINII